MTLPAKRFSVEENPILHPFRLDGLNTRSWEKSDLAEASPEDSTEVILAFDLGAESEPISLEGLRPRLAAARRSLHPAGVLLLAVPNRLGLRLWSGAPNPEGGALFSMLGGGAASPTSPRYFGRGQLKATLEEAGFRPLEWFYADATIGIPRQSRTLVSENLVATHPNLAAELLFGAPSADTTFERVELFAESIAGAELANLGLLPEFANAFLVAAASSDSAQPNSAWSRLRPRTEEVGWRLSNAARRAAVATIFENTECALVARKRLLHPGDVAGSDAFQWVDQPPCPIAPGELLVRHLERLLIEGSDSEFLEEFVRFHRFIRERFPSAHDRRDRLAGEAIDAVVSNATRSSAERYHLFDIEWRAREEVGTTWWILRNLQSCLALRGDPRPAFPTPSALYASLCARLDLVPALDADLDSESRFASQVTCASSSDFRSALARRFEEPWPTSVAQGKRRFEAAAALAATRILAP